MSFLFIMRFGQLFGVDFGAVEAEVSGLEDRFRNCRFISDCLLHSDGLGFDRGFLAESFEDIFVLFAQKLPCRSVGRFGVKGIGMF